MPKLPVAKTREAKNLYQETEQKKVYKEVYEHYTDSWDNVVAPNEAGFREKEALLINQNLDRISQSQTSANVSDNRLSTILLERAARVMAQNPSGKALAMSKDDKGKNMLMNLMIDKWILPNANSQFQFLTKMRMWDMYSMAYGAYFTLTDFIFSDTYQGPDLYLLPMRFCRPQPNKFSLNDSDWFGVSSWVSPEWLKGRNKETWKNIDKLCLKMKEGKSDAAGEGDASKRTYIEEQRPPSVVKDKAFKTVEIYTEYRKDRWITICPTFNDDNGDGMILRDIANPHENDMLPIVAKYCFPLMDSIYGLGEFERGKSLQYALNSLWNLYLDGVKMSIFPPLILNADGIVPSSIVMEPAAKWLETRPDSIKQLNLSPQGINSFQNTYQYLVAALQNQAGTTDTTVSSSTDPTMGKTPEALRLQAARENSRDNWDRYMMEEALEQVMDRFVNLTASKIEKPIEMRLFAHEIKDIQKMYPDVVEMTEGADRGKVKITGKEFKGTKFDYQITKGSIYKVDQEKEQQNLTAILNFTLQNYQMINPALKEKGKMVDMGELYQQWINASSLQDGSKIVIDIPPEVQQQEDQINQAGGQLDQFAEQLGQTAQNGAPQEQPMQQGPLSGNFQDPDIAAFAQQAFGGVNG